MIMNTNICTEIVISSYDHLIRDTFDSKNCRDEILFQLSACFKYLQCRSIKLADPSTQIPYTSILNTGDFSFLKYHRTESKEYDLHISPSIFFFFRQKYAGQQMDQPGEKILNISPTIICIHLFLITTCFITTHALV